MADEKRLYDANLTITGWSPLDPAARKEIKHEYADQPMSGIIALEQTANVCFAPLGAAVKGTWNVSIVFTYLNKETGKREYGYTESADKTDWDAWKKANSKFVDAMIAVGAGAALQKAEKYTQGEKTFLEEKKKAAVVQVPTK